MTKVAGKGSELFNIYSTDKCPVVTAHEVHEAVIEPFSSLGERTLLDPHTNPISKIQNQADICVDLENQGFFESIGKYDTKEGERICLDIR